MGCVAHLSITAGHDLAVIKLFITEVGADEALPMSSTLFRLVLMLLPIAMQAEAGSDTARRREVSGQLQTPTRRSRPRTPWRHPCVPSQVDSAFLAVFDSPSYARHECSAPQREGSLEF